MPPVPNYRLHICGGSNHHLQLRRLPEAEETSDVFIYAVCIPYISTGEGSPRWRRRRGQRTRIHPTFRHHYSLASCRRIVHLTLEVLIRLRKVPWVLVDPVSPLFLIEMSCFSCFASRTSSFNTRRITSHEGSHRETAAKSEIKTKKVSPETAKLAANGNIAAHSFTFRELAAATKNFQPQCLLGEGGFGRVYKGHLENTGQVVAVKQLDRNGLLGHDEFLTEISTLNLLHHPNLVNLVGYCVDGDQRLLVCEFMPLGSLEDHLHGQLHQKPLNWVTRMKVATGVARGLEYLHESANPPVIYRDLKPSNILLDGEFNPKLTDFGLNKLGPSGDKIQVTSRIMGRDGYYAPECTRNGQLTVKSDVYSFGVVLLQLISGRRAIDTTMPTNEQNLVSWAQPIFKDQKRFQELVDPLLHGDYPVMELNQAIAVAAMCLHEEATVRPLMADVVAALSFLSVSPLPGSTDLESKPPAQSCQHFEIDGLQIDQGHAHPNEATRRSSCSSSSDGDYIIMGN